MRFQDTIINFFVTYGFSLIGAVLILVAGILVARWVGRWVDAWLSRIQIEPPVRMLLARTARVVVVAFALVLVAAKLGVDIAPMVAGIGVIGVGIGLAMQGVLSNICAGLTIIFVKPFRVGEYIEVIGVEGAVKSIELLSTKLLHTDGSEVVIPNRKIVGEVLHNYGNTRQLDLTVGVAYGSDLEKVEQIVRTVLRQNPRVRPEPPPVVGIHSFADSEILISVKPWVAITDYVAAPLELYRAISEQFALNDIDMPFPQREIRVLPSSNGMAELRRGGDLLGSASIKS